MQQLPPPAVRLLEEMPRRAGSLWAFPGRNLDGRYSAGGLDRAWQAVREAAKLEDVRIHDLRHSCAANSTKGPFLLIVFGLAPSPSSNSHRIE